MSRRCRRKRTVEQAVQFAKSLVRGEPDRDKIISTIFEDKVKEMI